MTAQQPHFSVALHILASLPAGEHDLLARELNVYSEAIRSRAGRTSFTANELQTLLWRMYDVARIVPAVTAAQAVDMDELAQAVKPPAIAKPRRVE